MRELNVVFADKYLSGYDLRRQNDNDLSEFITKHLSGSSKDEYLHRRQMLKEKLDGNSDKLSQEILRLEQNIVELNDKHLHQIITRENIDSVFSISNTNEIGITTNFNDIKGSEYFDLLKYIIRNGYIDESYADYMTYFYENSLSRVDKTFLRSVTDKKAKEYTYKLKNPQLVVSRLRLADFGQEETLNFDLLTYLLKSSRKDYIERFIDQLKQTNNFDFVGAYFDLTAELPNYIKHLNIGWPEMFSTALSLFSSFEQWDDSIQEKIFDHAVNNISCIIDNQDSIPTKLIKSLLNSESVSRDEKLDLFAAIMPGLCVDDIQSILILLNLTDYLKIFDMRSRPKFEINNESEKLLAAFKECHLIDSYEESTTKAGYYKVARPKATKALSKEPSTVT